MPMNVTAFAADRPLTDLAFCAWIAQALPGDRIEYHRGVLALDRTRSEIDWLAARALWAFEQGLVHLVQQRAGSDGYVYIAVARRKPRRPLAGPLFDGIAR